MLRWALATCLRALADRIDGEEEPLDFGWMRLWFGEVPAEEVRPRGWAAPSEREPRCRVAGVVCGVRDDGVLVATGPHAAQDSRRAPAASPPPEQRAPRPEAGRGIEPPGISFDRYLDDGGA